MIEKSWGAPTVTKDGVTVAKEIELEDKFENMGAQMVKEVASKTSDVAGDGTTTATVLAQAIFREGSKLVAAGMNPMELKRGIDKAVAAIVEELSKHVASPRATPTRSRRSAPISANGDETIGKMIAEAMEKVGKEGVITVEEAKSIETVLEVVEGMQFDRGYLSPYFVTDPERMEAVLEDAAHPAPREEDLEHEGPAAGARAGGAPGQAAADHRRGRRGRGARDARREQDPRHAAGGRGEGAGLRRPPQGDARGHRDPDRRPGDRRGARAQARERDAQGPRPRQAGRRSTRTTRRSSTAPATKKAIEGRVQRDPQRRSRRPPRDYDREKLQERLAKLAGGVAVVKVGAATEVEMKEKKARVEDALHATRAAVEEGIVPGGGVALLRAQTALDGLEDGLQATSSAPASNDRAPRGRGAAAPDRARTRASRARSWSTR